MKKEYTKPFVVFENFSMSTNIAADCEITNKEDPRLYYSGVGFAFTISSCEFGIIAEGGDGEFNGICYHVIKNFNLFNS